MLNAARSADIDLTEPIRQTTIEAKKQRGKGGRRKEKVDERKKYCIVSLYDKLRKWGMRIGGNGLEMGP